MPRSDPAEQDFLRQSDLAAPFHTGPKPLLEKREGRQLLRNCEIQGKFKEEKGEDGHPTEPENQIISLIQDYQRFFRRDSFIVLFYFTQYAMLCLYISYKVLMGGRVIPFFVEEQSSLGVPSSFFLFSPLFHKDEAVLAP